MHTVNTILMRGDRDRIFTLAADIQDWARILPHYRYVVVEERSATHKIARMGATRDGFPVRWRCRQELVPREYRILFQHIGGISKGMAVEWTLVPEGDAVRVTISHELRYPVPFVGAWFADWIVGRLFVSNIAGKTLSCIKAMVEAERAASLSPVSVP